MSFLRDIRRRADEVALEADKVLRIQRKQSEVGQLQKQIQQKLGEMGAAAYALHQEGKALPPPLPQLSQSIDELYNAVRAGQDEIEAIRQQALPPPPAAGGRPCTSCGRPLPADAAFCLHCGARVPAPPPMIACPHCGTALPADARFCANCGQTVAAMPSPTPPQAPAVAHVCPKCGAGMTEGASFCEECGAPLQVEPVKAQSLPDEHLVAVTQPELEAGRDQMMEEPVPVAVADATQQSLSNEPSYCATCAAEVPAGAPFCPVCGAATEHAT